MGIKNLTADTRGFLSSFFHMAAMSFKESVREIKPGLSQAVTPPAGSLAADFHRVTFLLRRGSLDDVNVAIDDLIARVNAESDPQTLDALEDIKLKQQLIYRHIRTEKKLQDDLGAFATKIF